MAEDNTTPEVKYTDADVDALRANGILAMDAYSVNK